jgi:phage terminase small subunit
MARKKLTPLRENFIEEYLIDLNATQAAIRAGYSKKTAYSQGQRLLKIVEIQTAIQKRREALKDKAEISQERVLREEMRLAFFDPVGLFDENGTLLNLNKLPEDARRAIAGLDVIRQVDGSLKFKYRLESKGRSLERISRHLGMYNDKLNLGLSAETLRAILSGLPTELAQEVRKALGKLVSKK